MNQCIFCSIVTGQIPSKKIYEDDKIIAVLDIHPAVAGHLLIVPKDHITYFEELNEKILNHIISISHRLSGVMIANLKSVGVTGLIQSGEYAGQKSPHFIMHIIPRFENDDLNFSSTGEIVDAKNMQTVFRKLKKEIDK